ncbi:MAG: glycosyltransferase [Cyclobacteriaceae bacterium]
MNPKYSIVVPVYNRPDEIDELLATLDQQTFKDFEVIVVEDGSTVKAEEVVDFHRSKINVKYYFKINEGQGFARNYGFKKATGEYLIVLDSDCLIPSHYLQSIDDYISQHQVDAFGGPDAAHPSFTNVQKAISHTMTSFFTTGGIRGNKSHIGTYHPRSFNMGMSRKVYERTKGYRIPFMGEDMEFSTRILKEGFKTALIPEAFVYHKRRTDPLKFFKQLRYFGRARINLSRFHQGQVNLLHLFPTVFSFGLLISILIPFLISGWIAWVGLGCYLAYLLLVLLECVVKTKSLGVALLTPVMTLLQMTGYGFGLVYEWVRKLRGIDPNTKYIDLY